MINFRDQIFNRSKQLKDEDLITIHHNLMKCYGWIPLKDLAEMPLPMLFNLNKLASEDNNKWESFRLCSLKYYGVKNPK